MVSSALVPLPVAAVAAVGQLGNPPRHKRPVKSRGATSDHTHHRPKQAAESRGATSDYTHDLPKQAAEDPIEDTCLPALDPAVRRFGFAMDQDLWIDRQMRPGSRLFAVGDSIMTHVLALGRPALGCTRAQECEGIAPFTSGGSESWTDDLDLTDSKHINEGWQHLTRYMLRSNESAISTIEGWVVAPATKDKEHPTTIWEPVALLQKLFNEDARPTEDDVMIIGLMGNHFTSEHLAGWDRYAQLLMRDVVTPFPGRVVILGTSPQHFKMKGRAYDSALNQTSCAPNPWPSDVDGGTAKRRSDVWGYNVWKHMKNKRARFVDTYEMLRPLWRCHRSELDCTHWLDPVVSIQVGLALDALHRIG